ncbi:MAG: HNH endonuclease [Verrucomicrobia bacterium]|nr:HNH endonuclease [Verrucomicrobiota bacterium]
MARRKTKNRTGLARIEGILFHNVWVGFVCLKCRELTTIDIGTKMIDPQTAFETVSWPCQKCSYVHTKDSDLPFQDWPSEFSDHESGRAKRFWLGFFRIATEHPESYWKQCNTCGRVLPFNAFSKHSGWGALERQMECRSCKGAINAVLNPRRTKQQLHEASAKRRVADLLLEGENKPLDLKDLFRRFESKCFKCVKVLGFGKRGTWAVDHILPSKYLYPLTRENAALLCTDCNNGKHDRWPSRYYSNNELIGLSRITGADLSLLANSTPIVNASIDVNACVSRFLKVREHSNLKKRLLELKKLLADYGLAGKLSARNRRMLGFQK